MIKHVAYWCVATLVLASCSAPTLEELNEKWGTVPVTPTVAEFNPAADIPVLPFPVDFAFFLGSEDGTMNIPVPDTNEWGGETGIRNALNTLDGISTLIPMSATFNGTVDSTTVIAGDTIRIFEVTKSSPYLAISGIVRELSTAEYSVHMTHRYVEIQDSESNGTLKEDKDGKPLMIEVLRDGIEVIPTIPLATDTAYMVVVGTGIIDTAGRNIEADLIYGICKGGSSLLDRYGHTTVPIAMTDEEAALLDQLRALTNTYEILLGLQAGIGSGSVALAWTFTTQSVSPMLKAVAETTEASNVLVGPVVDPSAGQVTTTIVDPSLGGADIWVGSIEVPYYLSKENANGPTNIWKGLLGNFLTKHYYELIGSGPVAESVETIPFVLTLPNAGSAPAGGWPVTIFQHDLTRNRFDSLAIADSMAAAGRAVIAIDLPHHGVDKYNEYDLTSGAAKVSSGINELYAFSGDAPAGYLTCGSCSSPGATADESCGDDCGTTLCSVPAGGVYANHPSFASVIGSLGERTLDIDGDGELDGSGLPMGTNYINLASGLNMRDNIRQGAVDLMVLRASIGSIPGLDGSNVAFVGHGIGASVGVLFLSEADDLGLATAPSVLVGPLSGIARSMEVSGNFSVLMELGLLTAGISKGTPTWDAFFWSWQTFLDPADPVNFAGSVSGPTLMLEMAGDGVLGNNGDTVYPTSYGDGPWTASGSSYLASSMGLSGVSSTTVSASGVNAIVRFSSSDHGSFLDPGTVACEAKKCDLAEYYECAAPKAAITKEMQTQAVSFIASGGTQLPVNVSVTDALGQEARVVCEPAGSACSANDECCGKMNCTDSVCE